MSRYTKKQGNNLFVYGFDRGPGEYFFACYDISQGEFTRPENCRFNVASGFSLKPHPAQPKLTSYSNTEMVELMNGYPGVVDSQHLNAIALDIPF